MRSRLVVAAMSSALLMGCASRFPVLDTPQKAIDAYVHAVNTHSASELAYVTRPPQSEQYAWPDTVTSVRILSQQQMPGFLEAMQADPDIYSSTGGLAVVVDHTYIKEEECGESKCPKHEAHLVSTYHLIENDGQWAVVSPDKLLFPDYSLPVEQALEYTRALQYLDEPGLAMQKIPPGNVSYRMTIFGLYGGGARKMVRVDYDGHKAMLSIKIPVDSDKKYTTTQRELTETEYKFLLDRIDKDGIWEQPQDEASPVEKGGFEVHGDGTEVLLEISSDTQYKLIDRWTGRGLKWNDSFDGGKPHHEREKLLFSFMDYFDSQEITAK